MYVSSGNTSEYLREFIKKKFVKTYLRMIKEAAVYMCFVWKTFLNYSESSLKKKLVKTYPRIFFIFHLDVFCVVNISEYIIEFIEEVVCKDIFEEAHSYI